MRIIRCSLPAALAVAALACGTVEDPSPPHDGATSDDTEVAQDTAAAHDTATDTATVDGVADTSAPPEDTGPEGDTTGPPTIPIIDDPDLVAPELDSGERPIEVVRTFACVPEGVGAELVVAEVVNAPGAAVTIRPSDPASCAFELVYRDPDGTPHVLSESAGGYLFAAGLHIPDGPTLVCANHIHHVPDDVSHDDADVGATGRWVEAVSIECAARVGGAWSALTPMVEPAGEWAAWLRDLAVHPSLTGAFTLSFARDFSFHFFNLSDHGRPSEDGVYEVAFGLGGDGSFEPGPPVKVSERTNPFHDAELQEWLPTEAEKAELSHIIDFSDGPCPEGCPLPDE